MIKESGLNRHEIIKFALRRYLFPNETVVPLNGKSIHYHAYHAPSQGECGLEEVFEAIPDSEKKITIVKDPEKMITITRDKDEE